jgi:hypothetical protein
MAVVFTFSLGDRPERATYAGVEANGLRVHAQAAELDQLLELDG